MKELLYTDKLSVGYGETSVVRDIALAAKPGQVLCLIGPNGAGKSTLLKTLMGALPPTEGSVYLDGRELRDYHERELARLSAAVLTMRPEPELLSAAEVVAVGRYPYTGRLGILTDEDRRIVLKSMEKVGVSELADTDFSLLSDGQRQRVLLARALCQQPRLLILDEPTSFLDIRHKIDFLQLVRELIAGGELAVVMSMHELELAQRFADTLLCIRGGRVDRMGSPEEIFSGGYIEQLFSIEHGSYDALAGTAEAPRIEGAPHVFVIGGGGSGIPLYRKLRRLGIPFAAGVLPGNDLDLPTARALAAVVITDRANEPVSAEEVDEAMEVLKACKRVICTTDFGSVNRENHRLLEYAERNDLLCPAEKIRASI